MILTSILVFALIFNIILAYNSIMTIICCNKMDKSNSFGEWNKYNDKSDEYAIRVKPAMYLTMFLYALYFIVKWVS